MHAAVEVVRAHDAPCPALDDGLAECGQVYLVERAVVEIDVDRVAVRLLVVERIVLDACGHALLLYLADVGHGHLAGKVGVLAHVLEVAASERRAVYVDAGTEQHVLLAVARLGTYRAAVERRHVAVPSRGQGRERGIGRARVVGPAGLLPLVPQHLGTYAVRAVGAPQLGDAQTRHAGRREFRLGVDHGYLFVERHSRQCVLDALLDSGGGVEIDRSLLCLGERRSERDGA